jgi:hypothetical protein
MDGWADGLERACDESCYDALDNWAGEDWR